jgi:uncharacterized protein DUF3667
MSATAAACANCNAGLATGQKFCGECGQRATPQRLTTGQMLHDFMHALTHVDRSIFALIKALAYRPGHVAREYVEGKRKKYFGPLAFLLITVGFASFLVVLSRAQFFSPVPDNSIASFLQQHINIIILMQMPLLAGVCALLFRGSRLYFAEHLVLAAYTTGFRMLFLALVVVPVVYFAKLSPVEPRTAPAYLGLWLIYYSVAAVQFYRGKTLWTVVRAVTGAVLAHVVAMLLVVFCIYLYAKFAYS